MNVEGSIPIKPHLKQFIKWIENLEGDEPIDLYRRTSIPRILKLLLTFKTEIKIDSERPVPADLTDNIKYKLTLKRLDRGDIHLTTAGIIEFNNYIHYLFHDLLLMRIMHEMPAKTEKRIIYEFMEEIGIDDLVNFDAIKKSSYRLRKEKKMPVFSDRNGVLSESLV